MIPEHLKREPEQHNEEVKRVWEAQGKGTPERVPMTLGICIRYYMPIPEANPKNIWYEEYFTDPDAMLDLQLSAQKWSRENINYCYDAQVALKPDFWMVYVDFQNSYGPEWYGAPLTYIRGQVPDVRPILEGDNKDILFDRGMPDPFEGPCMRKVKQFYEHWKNKLENYEYLGRPVKIVGMSGLGTDGPLTSATQLRGTELYTDFYTDPDYVHRLLGFITDCEIKRVQAWKEYLGPDFPKNWWDAFGEGKAGDNSGKWGFGDDSLELISGELYEEFVLPYHKKLIDTFGWKGPNFIHLCGDAQRHFKKLRDELNMMTFDTGFPIDFAKLRDELGEDVTIYGGVNIALLKNGTPEEVYEETKRILLSGIMRGGKFILREANNLAPGTPLENLSAMYKACREYGRY